MAAYRRRGRSIREDAQDKFSFEELVVAPGFIKVPHFILRSETKLRVVIIGSGGGNEVTLRANIINSPFFPIYTVTGDQNVLVDVATYDNFQLECTNYAGTPFEVIISGFFSGLVYL